MSEQQVVLITGAGRPNGIGAGIARCFAETGAQVIISDLEGSPIDDTVRSLPGAVTGMVADASSQESMSNAASQTVAQFGRINVLVNNAGIGGPQLKLPGITDSKETSNDEVLFMDESAWDSQLVSNLRTTFAASSAVGPKLDQGGSIVNIASVAALGPTPDLAAYGAAKAGVVHFTRTLAIQLAPRRIRANCICPGLLWTRAWEMMTENMKAQNPELDNVSPREIFQGMVERSTPLGSEQTPEDIGNLAVFYASDRARMITGAVVAVDGGMTLV